MGIEPRPLRQPLSDASRRIGVHVDGFIGADVLTEFRRARINFEMRTMELER